MIPTISLRFLLFIVRPQKISKYLCFSAFPCKKGNPCRLGPTGTEYPNLFITDNEDPKNQDGKLMADWSLPAPKLKVNVSFKNDLKSLLYVKMRPEGSELIELGAGKDVTLLLEIGEKFNILVGADKHAFVHVADLEIGSDGYIFLEYLCARDPRIPCKLSPPGMKKGQISFEFDSKQDIVAKATDLS